MTAWFVRTLAWSYIGTKDPNAPVMAEASIVDHATAEFPPTWISAGNDDPLEPQSVALQHRLEELGVDVTGLFWPGHVPGLPHEYQMDLDTEAGRRALADTIAFLDRITTHR